MPQSHSLSSIYYKYLLIQYKIIQKTHNILKYSIPNTNIGYQRVTTSFGQFMKHIEVITKLQSEKNFIQAIYQAKGKQSITNS